MTKETLEKLDSLIDDLFKKLEDQIGDNTKLEAENERLRELLLNPIDNK